MGNLEKCTKDKEYAKPFKLDGRQIVLVGANFASDMSALDGVLVEEGENISRPSFGVHIMFFAS